MKYDVEYYQNLLRIHTHTAIQINAIRWGFLAKIDFNHKEITVLDYGCGVGWFAAFRPKAPKVLTVDTFDIMPVPQSGIVHDKYDLVTFWDVLEHIPDFTEIKPVLDKTDFVALSIPIKPPCMFWDKWKHFKPGEHLHYYSVELLEALFNYYSFDLMVDEMPECPPREDVHSIIFKKREA